MDVFVDEDKPTNDGTVMIDDKDIREDDIRWLRNNMGYVGQEPVLFNDTIKNNINFYYISITTTWRQKILGYNYNCLKEIFIIFNYNYIEPTLLSS